MSVSLTTYPVITSSGKVRNIFAGFQAVELEFKREDAVVNNVTSGVDGKILISITGDITSSLNVGEWVYIYSECTNYTYDDSFQITSIIYSAPYTFITVNGDYIETGTGGYCNYKQNWYLESKLVNTINNNILNYPSLLQTDGNPNGVVNVNTSMLVDFLKNEILLTSQEITGARKDCKVMYREVWREDDTQTFTLVDEDPIVIIFAAEDSEIEDFVNGFEIPKIWEGYPFYINLLHSLENSVDLRVSVSFDELDINKTNLTTNNAILDFDDNDFGILQTNFADKTTVLNDNTKYIRFNANTSSIPDFKAGDFKAGDFKTT